MSAVAEVEDDREAMHRARSQRYAEALAAAALADERIKALTDLLADAEFVRRTAEDAAGMVRYLDDYDQHVYKVGDPEPGERVDHLVSLSTGLIFTSVSWREGDRQGWHRVDYGSNSVEDWASVLEHSPFIGLTANASGYGIDRIITVTREKVETERELNRRLPSEDHRQSLPDRVDYLKRTHAEALTAEQATVRARNERIRHLEFLGERMADALTSGDTEQGVIALAAWTERTVDVR